MTGDAKGLILASTGVGVPRVGFPSYIVVFATNTDDDGGDGWWISGAVEVVYGCFFKYEKKKKNMCAVDVL